MSDPKNNNDGCWGHLANAIMVGVFLWFLFRELHNFRERIESLEKKLETQQLK